MENENLENKPNIKKSNLRNYDENPIIMKDYGISVNYYSIAFFIALNVLGFIFGLITFRKEIILYALYFPMFKFIFDGYSERKNSHYYFENSKITHAKNKYLPIQELNLNDIKEIEKVTYAISPYDNEKAELPFPRWLGIACVIVMGATYIAYFILIGTLNEILLFIFIITLGIFIIFIPTIFLQYLLGERHFRIRDTLKIKTKDDEVIKIYIPTQSQYNEIRKYFIYKIGKDINKMQKSFFEKEI
ncbi:MAG: hypothetical protein IJ211_01820 [Campylobacter sp.]|nr:hypothetical protein [Campylobacter sp.]